jgi:hypothetical protein
MPSCILQPIQSYVFQTIKTISDTDHKEILAVANETAESKNTELPGWQS